MRLLVTGGAGFIGSNVIPRFLLRPELEQLVNLDCLTYAGQIENLLLAAEDPRYRFVQANLRDKSVVRQVFEDFAITHVLHLAAESHVDRSIVGPDDFIHTNILGTFHLLEACRAAWAADFRGKRFHQVSTDEVYGSLGPSGKFTEASPYAPSSPYSASKAAADLLVRSYQHTYGLPTVITNCSNNYGPYQFPEKLIPVVIQCVMQRRPIPVYGDGLQIRDWLYVGDHAEALWQVLTRGNIGETYNIGGHNEWTNLRIVEFICDLCDQLAPHSAGRSRCLVTFVPDRPGHDRRYAIDATKIRRELGWLPSYTFERGIRETIAWYLGNRAWIPPTSECEIQPSMSHAATRA